MELTILRPHRFRQWIDLYALYRTAFPRAERKPFSIIVNMYRKGKSDVWCIEKEHRFMGFATTINSDDLILLDYFAVAKSCRGQGIGSEALPALLQLYPEKGFFVEIESPYEDTPDRVARQQRKQFYIRCGLRPLKVMATVFGVKMELLGCNCQMSFERYQGFYRNHYSPFAAKNIVKESHPEAE